RSPQTSTTGLLVIPESAPISSRSSGGRVRHDVLTDRSRVPGFLPLRGAGSSAYLSSPPQTSHGPPTGPRTHDPATYPCPAARPHDARGIRETSPGTRRALCAASFRRGGLGRRAGPTAYLPTSSRPSPSRCGRLVSA